MRAAPISCGKQEMRRDYFTLNTADVTDYSERPPTIQITYGGPREELTTRLSRGNTVLDEGEIDVTYRLHEPLTADEPSGVFAISDRITGEYVLELDVDAEAIFEITDAVAERDENDGDGRYRIVIETVDGTEISSFDKSTLLVYDGDGDVLREQSLIPSGVEI